MPRLGLIGRSLIILALAGLSGLVFNLAAPQGISWLPPYVAHGTWEPTSLSEARRLFDQGALFLDTRSMEDYNAGHVYLASHFPPEKGMALGMTLRWTLMADQPVVIYGRFLSRWPAALVAQHMEESGYENIYVMEASYQDWAAAGYPTTKETYGP